jgi:hypothetical protein
MSGHKGLKILSGTLPIPRPGPGNFFPYAKLCIKGIMESDFLCKVFGESQLQVMKKNPIALHNVLSTEF